MKSIGFKNFRRFKNFPEINLGDITILVGANNSGKSTLIKAILLCQNNIRQQVKHAEITGDPIREYIKESPTFRFDATAWNDVKIKTFQRAFNNKTKNGNDINNPQKEDTILFSFSIGLLHFLLEIEGNKSIKDEIECSIKYIAIEDESTKRRFEEFFPSNQRRYTIIQENGDNHIYNLNYELHPDIELNVFPFIIKNFYNFSRGGYESNRYKEIVNRRITKNYISEEENEITRRILKYESEKIYKTYIGIKQIVGIAPFDYIQVHTSTHNYQYNTSDRNDYVAQTINEYYSSGIKHIDSEFKFVRKWLRKFEICDSFHINCIGGESYTVDMIKYKSHIVNLADMGVGSIQLFTLLIKIASIIKKYRLNIFEMKRRGLLDYGDSNIFEMEKHKIIKDSIIPTIIIEEPEQNLHPKIQSLLADLFFEVSQKYGLKFVVETHSEYLIRKSQVIVKDFAKKKNINNKEDLEKMNPFKVYYFDGNNEAEPYYEMKYGTNGLFNRKFGEGFIDISSKLLMDLL